MQSGSTTDGTPKHKMASSMAGEYFSTVATLYCNKLCFCDCAYLCVRHCAPMWVRGIMSASARLYSVVEGADGGSSRSQGEGLRTPGRSSPGRALSRPTELRREAQLSEGLARRRPAIRGGVLSIMECLCRRERWTVATHPSRGTFEIRTDKEIREGLFRLETAMHHAQGGGDVRWERSSAAMCS